MEQIGISPKAMRGRSSSELSVLHVVFVLCVARGKHSPKALRTAQELSLKNAEKLIERCIKWLGRLGDAAARTSDHSKSRFRTPTLSQVCPQL